MLKAYFTNAIRLRPGLSHAYESRIPNDSTATLETEGLLGETFVEIDTSTAFGPPIEETGILKTKPTTTAAQAVEKLVDNLTKQVKDLNSRLENCQNNNEVGVGKDRKSPRSTHSSR
jgi:ABC-type transporter Mla subunit MlaD